MFGWLGGLLSGYILQQDRLIEYYPADTEDTHSISYSNYDRIPLAQKAERLQDTHPICKTIDESLVLYSIGDGIFPQIKTNDTATNEYIEAKFNAFIENIDFLKRNSFVDIQESILYSILCNGDILIKKVIKNGNLQLQIIPYEYHDDSKYNKGIKLDDDGVLTHYVQSIEGKETLIPIEDAYLIKIRAKGNEVRALSDYKAVVEIAEDYSALIKSEVTSGKNRSKITYIFKSIANLLKSRSSAKSKTDTMKMQLEANRGEASILHVGADDNVEVLNNNQVNQSLPNFAQLVIRTITNARGVSYEMGFKDYSQTNFASAKASISYDYKKIANLQSRLIKAFLNPLFEDWIALEALKDSKLRKLISNKKIKPIWQVQPKILLEPHKEVKMQIEAVNEGLKAPSDAVKELTGLDYEDHLMKIKEDREQKEKILGKDKPQEKGAE